MASRAWVLIDAELLAIWKAADSEPTKLRAFVCLPIMAAARRLEAADIATGGVDLAARR